MVTKLRSITYRFWQNIIRLQLNLALSTCTFGLFFLAENDLAIAADNEIQSQEIRIYEIDERKFPLQLSVRSYGTSSTLPIYTRPDFQSQVLTRLPAKSIFQINLSLDKIIKREKLEQENQGQWQSFDIEGTTYYFYDYWQNVITLNNTSRGLSLKKRANTSENLVVFTDKPISVENDCQSNPTAQIFTEQNLNEIKDKNKPYRCIRWLGNKTHIYLAESKVALIKDGSGQSQYHLIYRVRFVEDKDIETTLLQGWVFARQLELRLDEVACDKEVCLNSALLTNQPEDVQKLFFDMGYVKRPTEEKQKVDTSFFAFAKNASTENETKLLYNRWIDRMNREITNPDDRNEIEYILSTRPLWFLGLGYSDFEFSQRGDNGNFEYSGSGPTIVGGLTFPLMLDIEILIQGQFVNTNNYSSRTVKRELKPVEITNDLIVTIPFKNAPASYFAGAGVTFRSLLNRSTDIGYNVMYGAHATTGFFYGTWTAYAHLGITAVDITSNLTNPEWHISFGKNFKYTKRGSWSAWLHYSGHEAETRDTNALTSEVDVTNYISKKTTASVTYEF